MNKTCCVVDGGLFVELAKRLSRDQTFERVFYCLTSRSPFPRVNEAVIGNVEGVERINDPWEVKDLVDVWCFPDIHSYALQTELIEQGKLVWGSRGGDWLELKRQRFKETLKQIGLAVGEYHVCNGLDELSEFLRDKKDQYVKVSRWRGSCETWHWVDDKTSSSKLDELAVTLGPAKNLIPFVVEAAIPTKIEWGYDGYCIDGEFPGISAQGPEIKDKSYIAAITKAKDLPDPIREINAKIAPILKLLEYRNFFSTEIRIAEDDTPYFIDPCCRMPSPAGEAQMELYENLGEIILAGAQGECIDPEPTAQFCVEALIEHQGDVDKWRKVVVPEEYRQWFKFWNVCEIDGACCIPPLQHSHDTVGAVLGLGDTLEEAISHLKENVEAVKDQPVIVYEDSLVDALAEIKHAENKGVEMTDQEVPEPATVLEDA